MEATVNLLGIEVFATGKHLGKSDTISIKDLDDCVEAFNETGKTFRPALKLGHSENQTLLQQDGYPAAGWISRLYRNGEKLLADFIDVPKKVYQLLKLGAYKQVSSEVWKNVPFNGKTYPRLLSGVALLGADMPAVTTLGDILKMYSFDGGEQGVYSFSTDGLMIDSSLTEEHRMTLEEMKAQLEAEQKKNEKYSVDLAALTSQVSELEKNSKEAEKKDAEITKLSTKVGELEGQLADKSLDAQVEALYSEKAISKAMKPLVKALLGPEKESYSVDKDKFSKAELLSKILALHKEAAKVNFTETTEKGEETAPDLDVKAVEKYAAEHKISFKAAYKILAKDAA